MQDKQRITVRATVRAGIEKAWTAYTDTDAITRWNAASPDWFCPRAANDLVPGGKFSFRMEARDGSFGFDFSGVYTEVRPRELIRYTMDDSREASVEFAARGDAVDSDAVDVTVTFEAEGENALELQRSGWQAILDNFRRYAEAR